MNAPTTQWCRRTKSYVQTTTAGGVVHVVLYTPPTPHPQKERRHA